MNFKITINHAQLATELNQALQAVAVNRAATVLTPEELTKIAVSVTGYNASFEGPPEIMQKLRNGTTGTP